MPRRDQSTRWNSWYEMIDRALRQIKQPLIHLLSEEPALTKDNLSSDDWQTSTYIRDFLASFYDTTKATEGRHATLDKVIPSLDFMAIQFEQALKKYNDHPYMKPCLHAGFTKLLKYWNRTERVPVYTAAMILDPTLKYTYFEDGWDPEWQPHIREQMRLFWESTYKPSATISRPSAPPVHLDNEFLRWMHRRRADTGADIDELERYINEPLLIQNNGTALHWWLMHEQRTRLPSYQRWLSISFLYLLCHLNLKESFPEPSIL